jgi:hypothetical protein
VFLNQRPGSSFQIFVQLQLEAHGQVVSHDPVGQVLAFT